MEAPHSSRPDLPTPNWRPLHLTAAVAAAITCVAIPSHVAVFITWPPPLEGTVLDWFRVFQGNWLLGLVSMDLLLMLDYLLLLPIYVALYVALRQRAPVVMTLGTAVALVTVPIYFASNPAIELLTLSGQHAAATSDAERALFSAAGQSLVATYQGTAFHVAYIVGSIAGVLLSAGMIPSPAFGRAAGWFGILGYVIGLGLYAPQIGLFFGVISGPVLWVWYLYLARGFYRLARGGDA